MKAFQYAHPRTEAEVAQLLAEKGTAAEVLAGGTDLVGLLKKMAVRPERVVNIMEVPTLKLIEPTADGGVKIGAAVHLDELLSLPYLENYPALVQAIQGMNSMQLQAQGTIGGDVCCRPQCWYFRNGRGLLAENGVLSQQGANEKHAIFRNSGPARFVSGSRLAPALIALGAKLRIVGPGPEEEQVLPAESLYRVPRKETEREVVLKPGQFVSHVILPGGQPNTGSATYEVKQSEGADYPLATASAALSFSGGVVAAARIVLGQVAPVPYVADEAARSVIGRVINPVTAEAAGETAIAKATPLAGNEYKVRLAKTAVKRALLMAAGYESGGF